MSPSFPSIAHIGVAVRDIDEALAFYTEVLGCTPHPLGEVDGARIVGVDMDGVDVELLSPVSTESPVAKFLEKRGPGIHHVCYRVANLDAALAACRAGGYRLVDEQPRVGAHGDRIAFVHPKSTAGILIELTEAAG